MRANDEMKPESPATNPARPIALSAPPGSPWVESWHNFDLRYCDVPEEHRNAWLRETSRWMHSGRRWPLNPTDAMVRHCEYWWEPVARMMRAHGWWHALSDWNLPGYDEPIGWVITWHHRNDGIYKLSQGACSAHYAGICGAALVRRKARYYGIWKRENNKERND